MNPPKLVKRVVRGALAPLGLEIKQKTSDRWLQELGIHTVLDVGANEGQFADEIRGILPEARIYSFEPIPKVFRRLEQRSSRDRNFVAFNCALGAEDTTMAMNVSRFSPASSLLEMDAAHKENFPYTREHSVEEVRVRRLDSVAAELEVSPEMLVKIDVEGYADRVIAGGEETISRARVLIVEVSFESLYVGEGSFAVVHRRLEQLGFKYGGNRDQLLAPLDGRILAGDAIYLR